MSLRILLFATVIVFSNLTSVKDKQALGAQDFIFSSGFEIDNTNWKLPVGYYIDENIPMVLTYPRPDTETSPFARHRNQYTNLEYQIPIAIRGGAYPFKYELIDAPVGATIGETLVIAGENLVVNDNYGVVNWLPEINGIVDFTVQVTDQNDAVVQVSWQVSVNTVNWVFIDSNAGNAGNGSLGDPYNSISDIDGIGNDKLLMFRAGSHIVPRTNNANNFIFESNFPRTFLSFPGEIATLDFSQSKFFRAYDDMFFGGLVYANIDGTYANSHQHFAAGVFHRTVWFNNIFTNAHTAGTAANENPAYLFFTGTSSHRQYISFIRNTFKDIVMGGEFRDNHILFNG